VTRHLDPHELLQIAASLPGDPACNDLGVLDAAAARTPAHYMGRDVYASHWLKAAALIETLALHEPLEAHNLLYAWTAGEAFLHANGHRLYYEPADALALVQGAGRREIDVREMAAALRRWTG
jgi:prophage maintenance system killer protein